MIDLKKLQEVVYQNKVEKGFNTTDMALEFCRAHEELSEAFAKYNKDEDGVAEELADVAIFLLGIAHTLGYDLEKELIGKIEKNKNRVYKKITNKEGKDVFIRERTPEDP
jgi:NTP pyrophosphatase (non-canonical NTP hydrolase)